MPSVKEERSKKIIELSNKIGEEINKTYIGRKVDVLIEEKEGIYYKGHTKNYIYVIVETDKVDIKNKIIQVTIEENQDNMLFGIAK